MRWLGSAAMVAMLAACAQQATPAATPKPKPPPKPTPLMAETFGTCAWGEVRGRTLSIWSYGCGPAAGDVRLAPTAEGDGFALVSTAKDGSAPSVVIRAFAKPAAAPVPAILPAVLAATGAHKASCRLVEHKGYGDWGDVWLLEPTGAEKAAYDAANATEPQDNPCGSLGIGPVGDRFFRLLPGDTARVIYADMGSEIQVFDLATLRSTTKAQR